MPSLKEIAQRAGVSSALISAYLNGRPSARMRRETKSRIDAALRETGYKPNPLARALSTGRSGIIGYLASSLQNEVSQQELLFIHEALAAHGYRMMTWYTKGEYLLFMEGCQGLVNFGCEGLISNAVSSKEALEYLGSMPVPVAGICKDPALKKRDFMIHLDYRPGIEEALASLRDAHRKAIFLSYTAPSPKQDQRQEVYREFFPEEPCEECRMEEMRDPSRVQEMLRRHPGADAFFCFNDHCAMAVWGSLQELGFRVPQDFALIGFDDLPLSMEPGLSSVRMPQKEMAENLVQLLCSSLQHTVFQGNRSLRTEFVPRRSSKSVSAEETGNRKQEIGNRKQEIVLGA